MMTSPSGMQLPKQLQLSLLPLLLVLIRESGGQLFGENMFEELKAGPLADKVRTIIDADLMEEDMEMSESLQTEHQIKLRDFYR